MAKQITIKRSPIVLFRTFALIEIGAFVAYALAMGHGNAKYDIYNELLFLPSLLSYQTAKIMMLTFAEFVITIYAFFHWYYETYTIRSGSIVHRYGVFFKKEKTVPLDASIALTVSSGPLGKIFHYGSIAIENGSSKHMIALADVSYPDLCRRAIEKVRSPQDHFAAAGDPAEIAGLLGADEHEQLEFKSSLRIDRNRGGVNREMERAAMKTIAAFMNSKGGNLILGVNDKGEVAGLADDYGSLPRKDSDGFENHFTQLFNKSIGPEKRNLVQLHFQTIGGQEVALVRVAKSPRPVYLKMDDNEYFYVRTGNATTPLKLSEVETYARSRWPRRAETV